MRPRPAWLPTPGSLWPYRPYIDADCGAPGLSTESIGEVHKEGGFYRCWWLKSFGTYLLPTKQSGGPRNVMVTIQH